MPLNSHSARGLSLSEILTEGRWLTGREPRIRSCSTSAEQCQAGDLFVVLDETDFVSQDLIELAIQRGAVAVLAERVIPCDAPQFLVDDVRQAFARVCQAVAGSPANAMHTLGITGSYGKTSTSVLLNAILNAAGETPDTLSSEELARHDAIRLAQRFAQSHLAGHSHMLIETSSETIAKQRLSGVPLDGAVLTNLLTEHTDEHGSMRNYLSSKREILGMLKPEGFAVVNADDRRSARLLPNIENPTITYGINRQAEIMATVLERHASEQTFLLDAGNESICVRTSVVGDAHVYNCLAATATALVLGVGLDAIVRGIESVTSIPGRLQRVECGQPFGLFINIAGSPRVLSHALKTLRQVTDRNLVCVAGICPRLSEDDRQDIGRVLENHSDRCVLTGTQLDRKLSLRNAHDVLDGFDRPAQAHLMPDRAKAICWSLAQAQQGDIVLVAGGGPVTSCDDANLCDEDVARYWLQNASLDRSCPWLPV